MGVTIPVRPEAPWVMRIITLFSAAGILFLSAAVAWPSSEKLNCADRGGLVVRASGVSEKKGTLEIALCRSSEEWNGKKDCFRTARIAIDSSPAEYVFRNLPAGEYASVIISTQHVHLEHHNCLEVVVVKGNPREVEKLASRIRATRGVKHCALSMATTGTHLS